MNTQVKKVIIFVKKAPTLNIDQGESMISPENRGHHIDD